jgi:hypothetical protein
MKDLYQHTPEFYSMYRFFNHSLCSSCTCFSCSLCRWCVLGSSKAPPLLIIASFFGSIFFIFKERTKPRLILGQSHGLVSQSNGLHQSHGLFPYSPKCKHRILLFWSNLRLRVKNTFHILRAIT